MVCVSVIMPAYNAQNTIKQAIDSVLAQTFGDFELIVINDHSTDDTRNIIMNYQSNDKRVLLVDNEINSGVSFSRNKGIEVAQGRYIAFLDSDDYWKQDKLEKQVKLMKEKKAVLSYTASAFIDYNGNPYDYVMEAETRTTLDTLLKKNLISCSSAMIISSVMKKLKMPSDKMYEDYYIWIKVLRRFKYAYGINEPLLVYRLSRKSKSSNRIKSAIMIYNTYKAVGYDLVLSTFFTLRYSIHSVSKRFYIKNVRYCKKSFGS